MLCVSKILAKTMASESRAQRQAALEERRRRIQELQETRRRRAEDTARVQASANANIEDLVSGILNEPAPVAPAPQEVQSAEEAEDVSRVSVKTVSGPGDAGSGTASTPSAAQTSLPVQEKTVETFCVSTQTDEYEFVEKNDPLLGENEDDEDEIKEETHVDEPVENDPPVETVQPKVLSSDEIEKEIKDEPFSSFLNSTSKKVERLLGSPILGDLLASPMGEKVDAGDEMDSRQRDATKFVSDQQLYECPKWTRGRDLTDIDWSPLHRDLVLSSYQSPSGEKSAPVPISTISPRDTSSESLTPRSGELQSDGLVAVWSLQLPNRPEHLLTTGSPVMTARFHPTDPTLIVGGCRSGQVVVWDVRSGRLPVQKSTAVIGSAASKGGHVQAVNGMRVLDAGVRAHALGLV